MLRHPGNKNLHLHYDQTFEGFPIMFDKGPFFYEYLKSLKRVVDCALDQYSRVMAFRVDLRLPIGMDLPRFAYTNEVISRFFESFAARIESNRRAAHRVNKVVHECKVRYFWVREIGLLGTPHYHTVILLNEDAFYSLGRRISDNMNMLTRLDRSWDSALSVRSNSYDGLVHIPDNAVYRLKRNAPVATDQLPNFFRRASYLCKAATKEFGSGQHAFGCSRG